MKPLARASWLPRMQGELAQRLTRLALVASGIALVVAGTALNGAMFVMEKRRLIEDMSSQAHVIATNAAAPMLFQDKEAATETLQALSESENVARATLFDVHEHMFADYWARDRAAPPPLVGAPGYEIVDGRLLIYQVVRINNETLGQIRFEVYMTPLYRHAAVFGLVTLAAAGCALLLVYLFAVGVRRDVNRIERRLDELAHRDPVTGLHNRHAAEAHIQELVRAEHLPTGFAVITIDLDNFKTINDTFGHAVGDGVLRLVAEKLLKAVPSGSRCYRFGGDEFVILCSGIQALREPQVFALSLKRALSGTAFVEGYEVNLNCSMGVARFPKDGSTSQEIMRASDTAMYAAKGHGKSTVVVYDAALRANSEERLRKEVALRHAIQQGELRLFYQPVVDTHAGVLVGVEALVRWQDPERGLIAPADFIDVAESSGLVVELGGWALSEAAHQLVRWSNMGLNRLSIAVNVSARQLRGGVLVGQYRDAVALSGCDPRRLEIELTEHTLVEDVEENLHTLSELRNFGVHIAIDDFGTGLSSLAYLKRLPIDKLKIDRSFVRDLPGDRSDAAIISAAVSMARALGLRVVAEGVETSQQLAAVCELGCDLAQGYLYSKPLDAEQFTLWASTYLQSPQLDVSASLLTQALSVNELRKGA